MYQPNLSNLYDVPKVLKNKNNNIHDIGIPDNLNIGGIRTSDMNPNKFNDWFYCFYKDESGEQK